MTLEQFVEKYNNKKVDFDGAYGGQCVDLYRQYVKECLNFPQSPSVVGAKDIWDSYLTSYFTRYNNSPTAVPKKGDIIIWGTKLGEFGHIAIFLDGTVTKFNSFDQNYPVGSACHIQSHTYTGVLGWLRAKEQQVAEANPIPDWFKTLLQERGLTLNNESEIRVIFDKARRYDDEIKELQEQIKSANETLSDKSIEVSSLLGKLQTATSKVDELETLYGKAKSERDTFSWEAEKLKIKVEELEKALDVVKNDYNALKIDYTTLQSTKISELSFYQLITLAIRKVFK